jgi:hypothetical protein
MSFEVHLTIEEELSVRHEVVFPGNPEPFPDYHFGVPYFHC